MASEKGCRRAAGWTARKLSWMIVASSLVWGGSGVRAAEPSAADRETARSLMKEGDRYFEAKDFPHALQAYQGAYAVVKVPTTGLSVSKTLIALNRLIEARDVALQVTRIPAAAGDPPMFAKARADAEDWARQLEGRIPSVKATVQGAADASSVQVAIDGAAWPKELAQLPRKVDPGKHVVTASAPGYQDVRVEVVVAEGEKKEVTLALQPAAGAPVVAPAPVAPTAAPGYPGPQPEASAPVGPPGPLPVAPPPPEKTATTSPNTLMWAGFAVGGAGIIVGSVTGIMSMSKTSSLKSGDTCPNSRCPPEKESDLNSAKTLATVSNIGFGIGIAGAAVGVIALLTAKPATSEKPPASASLTVRVEPVAWPGGLGLVGRF